MEEEKLTPKELRSREVVESVADFFESLGQKLREDISKISAKSIEDQRGYFNPAAITGALATLAEVIFTTMTEAAKGRVIVVQYATRPDLPAEMSKAVEQAAAEVVAKARRLN